MSLRCQHAVPWVRSFVPWIPRAVCRSRLRGDRQEQEGKRLPVGALHALRGGGPSAATEEPAGPDAATEQGLAGIPCGGTVEGLAHVDLVRVRRDGDGVKVDTRPRRGTEESIISCACYERRPV
jgi:hypothetical protein